MHVRFHERDKKKLGSDHAGKKGNFKIRIGRRLPLGDYLIKAEQAEIGPGAGSPAFAGSTDRSVSIPSSERGVAKAYICLHDAY